MNQYFYHNLRIEVFDDPLYDMDSTGGIGKYAKQYSSIDEHLRPSAKHGVRVFRDNEEVASCLLIAGYGATSIHGNSSLLDDDQLVVCCSGSLFCLRLPNLELNWELAADRITCFKVLPLLGDYLVHGETEVSRIGRNGTIVWQHGGKDIFVNLEGEDECVLAKDHIMLTDFNKTKYKISFDGVTISCTDDIPGNRISKWFKKIFAFSWKQ